VDYRGDEFSFERIEQEAGEPAAAR
jgi:hypothetical protein